MRSVITKDNVRSFAYVSDALLSGPARGIVIDFMGLGGMTMVGEDTGDGRGRRYGEKGIVFVIPYVNPWAWMNPFAVRETDEILAAVYERIGGEVPLVASGGSMGGLSCLVYTRYAARTPIACVANCPVCDLPYHYTERPDLPRTLYSAFGDTDAETLDDAMKKASPYHLALNREMPRIPYTIFHCTADRAVNKAMHSDRFVAELEKFAPVDYIPVPDRDHCDLGPDMWVKYEETILGAFH
ncbi:MAG: hypothetical protein K6A33_12360 [Clostridiales bacterium]|nr:hypothetical protein [Clostridiales bacterium]